MCDKRSAKKSILPVHKVPRKRNFDSATYTQLYITNDFRLSRDSTSGIPYFSRSNMSRGINRLISKQNTLKSLATDNIPVVQVEEEEVPPARPESRPATPLQDEPAEPTAEASEDESSRASSGATSVDDAHTQPDPDDQQNAQEICTPDFAQTFTVHGETQRDMSPPPQHYINLLRKVPAPEPATMTMLRYLTQLHLYHIPLSAYQAAYASHEKLMKKVSNQVRLLILNLLTVWAHELSSPSNLPTSSLQALVNSLPTDHTLCTALLSVKQRKMLDGWLTPFVKKSGAKSTEAQKRPTSSASRSTPAKASRTSTSYTPVAGTSGAAAAPHYGDYRPAPAGREGLHFLTSLPYRTSSNYNSISFNHLDDRYTLKSENKNGDRLLKFETYNWADIRDLPSGEWWRHSDCKIVSRFNSTSQVGQIAEQLLTTLTREYEGEEDMNATRTRRYQRK